MFRSSPVIHEALVEVAESVTALPEHLRVVELLHVVASAEDLSDDPSHRLAVSQLLAHAVATVVVGRRLTEVAAVECTVAVVVAAVVGVAAVRHRSVVGERRLVAELVQSGEVCRNDVHHASRRGSLAELASLLARNMVEGEIGKIRADRVLLPARADERLERSNVEILALLRDGLRVVLGRVEDDVATVADAELAQKESLGAALIECRRGLVEERIHGALHV
mmetsp:Transcript_15647/g.61137  ORF Transcript_15647/g.61137 Transcript_15647/m.61137 type:complete len:223 (-) Transcript_15647:678-1346(-)